MNTLGKIIGVISVLALAALPIGGVILLLGGAWSGNARWMITGGIALLLSLLAGWICWAIYVIRKTERVHKNNSDDFFSNFS